MTASSPPAGGATGSLPIAHRSEPVQGPPPTTSGSLAGLPRAATSDPWYREHQDRSASPDRGCWFFSGTEPGKEPAGRFDLDQPNGTCYFGETQGVAVRERCGRFLAAGVPIPPEHYQNRVVTTVSRPSTARPIADLAHPDAATFRVTGELAAGNDYRCSAAWAAAVNRDGFDGIRYVPRFTPGGEAAYAIFGGAGPQSHRPVTYTTSLESVLLSLGYVPRSTPSFARMDVDPDAAPEER